MYTLYCLDGTRATAARMTLAEAGLSFERKTVDITARAHRTAEFLAINPRGTIPALADKNGTLVCETIAIMLYLADRHGLDELAPMWNDPQRAMLLDWLVYHAVEVQEPVKRSYYPHRYAVRADDVGAVRRNANQVFTQRWRLVEAHLRDNGPYHLGLRFSLADIYLLVTSTYSRDLASGEYPAIERCVQCTAERPQVAPILDDHLAGLARIGEIGVPQ